MSTKASPTILDLLRAGVHFGHQTGRWHPKMRPFIFGSRGGISIINLEKTLASLEAAIIFLRGVAERGGTVLFVGTKRQAKEIVRKHAERVGQPSVTERWIGGLFTNFETVGKLIRKYHTLQDGLAGGAYDRYTKKERRNLEKEMLRLEKFVGGIASLSSLPAAVFLIDTKQEKTAVHEARAVGIPTVALVDTNVNPQFITYPIPANDDATKAIDLITSLVADAIAEGRRLGNERRAGEEAAKLAATAEHQEVAA